METEEDKAVASQGDIFVHRDILIQHSTARVGQNRIYTPYMTV
jgi:hypothetical protein